MENGCFFFTVQYNIVYITQQLMKIDPCNCIREFSTASVYIHFFMMTWFVVIVLFISLENQIFFLFSVALSICSPTVKKNNRKQGHIPTLVPWRTPWTVGRKDINVCPSANWSMKLCIGFVQIAPKFLESSLSDRFAVVSVGFRTKKLYRII